MKNEKKSPAKFFGIGKLVSGIAAKVSAAGGGLTGIKALAMANPLATAAVIAGGAYLYSKHKKKKAKEKRQQGLLSDAQADFNERLKQYENLDFKPIDIDALKQENLLEDLEIDASAVEASQRAFAQSQANILQSLRGVGGSTGAASLATALSGQAADQAEKMRLSSSGFLGIGLTAPQHEISVGSTSSADASVSINGGTSSFPQVRFNRTSAESGEGRIFYDCSNNALAFMANGVEGLRLLSTGSFLVGKTSDSFGATGGRISSGGSMTLTANGNELMNLNRLTNDGALIYFSRDSSIIGTISVSSGFVTYGNFMGSHYTETAENEILLGTVMEFTGDLVEDKFTTGKHLSKAKISDSEESKNVYGVYFANHEDETGELISSLGASFCRINKDVTVEIGDLLVSNGDGTAKVQDDDLIKSKTIGKVTSTQKRDIYDDGSYTIPVVLYCG
jgi:hypothetical protein